MNLLLHTTLLIDIPGGGLLIGFLFFALLALFAYISFKLLRKTVKMAVRMTILVAVLLIAVVGGFSLWWFNTGTAQPARTAPGRTR